MKNGIYQERQLFTFHQPRHRRHRISGLIGIVVQLCCCADGFAGNDARFVSQRVPVTLVAGTSASVSVRMRNSGSTTWTPAAQYKLGTQDSQDNRVWGLNRVDLEPGESIVPGATKTFTFDIKAPEVPGQYNFQVRMLREHVQWFGDRSPLVVVTVTGPPDLDPIGNVDLANEDLLSGWARDPDFEGAIAVHVYVDDSFFDAISADVFRADVGPHAFNYEWDARHRLSPGQHVVKLFALGVDTAGNQDGHNPMLTGSPVQFEVSMPPPIYAVQDLTWVKKLPGGSVERVRAFDEAFASEAIEGIVNRDGPRLYLIHDSIDQFWLQFCIDDGWLLSANATNVTGGTEQLLSMFPGTIRGAIVWDGNVLATYDVATTLAGALNLLPVRYDSAPGTLYSRLVASGQLPAQVWLVNQDGSPLFGEQGRIPGTSRTSTGSQKVDAYLWCLENYVKPGLVNTASLLYQGNEYQGGSGRDYTISKAGVAFDFSPWADEAPADDPNQPIGADQRARLELLQAFTSGRPKMIELLGFTPGKYVTQRHSAAASEFQDIGQFSQYNIYKAVGAQNGSFFRHYPLEQSYPQPNLPKVEDLRQKGLIDSSGNVQPAKYIAYFAGDYDGSLVQSKLPGLTRAENMVDVPLGWALNPNAMDTFPVGLVYMRRIATPNMTFIAEDSGAGYINPGALEAPRASGLPDAVELWQEHCQPYYRRWDIGLTGFIIDGTSRHMTLRGYLSYAKFSPLGVGMQSRPLESEVDGVPFLAVESGSKGELYFGPSETAESSAQKMYGVTRKSDGTQFHLFRTILWTPKLHLNAFNRLKELDNRVRLVEPHVLMLLRKQYLDRQ